jgi:hypothetical protein
MKQSEYAALVAEGTRQFREEVFPVEMEEIVFLMSLLNIRLGYWLPNPPRPRLPPHRRGLCGPRGGGSGAGRDRGLVSWPPRRARGREEGGRVASTDPAQGRAPLVGATLTA